MKQFNPPQLSDIKSLGYETAKSAAHRRNVNLVTVTQWIRNGLIPAIAVKNGIKPDEDVSLYLLKIEDVDAFVPPKLGRTKKTPAA